MQVFENQRDGAVDRQAAQEAGQRVEKGAADRADILWRAGFGQVPIHLSRQPPQLRSRVRQGIRQRTRWTRPQQTIQCPGERCVRDVRIGRRVADQHRNTVVGQRSGYLRGQPRLARTGFTADEHRLAVAVCHSLPNLLEGREFRGATHERAAAACDQFGWDPWRHPLRHALNVMRRYSQVDSQF